MIPIDKCKNGWLYRIKSRNLKYGICIAGGHKFIGIREKFGHRYLDTELHYDCGAPAGTARPMVEIEFGYALPDLEIDDYYDLPNSVRREIFEYLREVECREETQNPV